MWGADQQNCRTDGQHTGGAALQMRSETRSWWDTLSLASPPIALICFCLIEQNFSFSEDSPFAWLGLLAVTAGLFFLTFAFAIIYLSARLKQSTLPYSILISLTFISGPFWELFVDVQPSFHAFSGLIAVVYVSLSLVFGVYWICAATWRCLRSFSSGN